MECEDEIKESVTLSFPLLCICTTHFEMTMYIVVTELLAFTSYSMSAGSQTTSTAPASAQISSYES